MADIISGATFFAPADLGTGLTENGVLIAGQSFNGSYKGEYAGFPVANSGTSYASSDKVVIVNTQLTALDPIVDKTLKVVVDNAFVNRGTLAISGSTISGSVLDFTGNTVTENGELVGKYNDKGEFQYWTHYQVEGGIICNANKLYLDNVTVTGNTMRDDDPDGSNTRGLLYNTGTMTVKDSLFSNNYTKTGSGYLIWNASANLNVSGSTFENNFGNGACMYVNSSGNTFTNTLFRYNLGAAERADGTLSINASGAVFNGQSGAKLTLEGCTFTGNTAGGGAAAHFAYNSVGVFANNSCFYDNVAVGSDGGGAFYLRSAGSEFTNCYFKGNTAGNGGAIRVFNSSHNREVTLTGCTFKGNSASNGGAVYTAGGSYLTVVNFTDCEFLTKSDTIYANSGTKQVIFNFAGNNTVNANIDGYGIVNVADKTTFNFDNDSKISISGMTFAGDATMHFSGTKTVTFAENQQFDNVSITVDASDYTEIGQTYVIAENVNGLTSYSLAVKAVGSAGYNQSLSYSDGTLYLNTALSAAIVDENGATVKTVNGNNYVGTNYTSLSAAIEKGKMVIVADSVTITERFAVGDSGRTLILNNVTAKNLSASTNGGVFTEGVKGNVQIYGGVFSGNSAGNRGGVIYNNVSKLDENPGNASVLKIDVAEINGKTVGALFENNVATGIGGVIWNTATANINGATFSHNIGKGGGAAYVGINHTAEMHVSNSLFMGNTSGGIGDSGFAYSTQGCISATLGALTITGSTFTKNYASEGGVTYPGGSAVCTMTVRDSAFYSNVAVSGDGGALGLRRSTDFEITNCYFSGNRAKDTGGALHMYSSSGVTITGSTFSGNSAEGGGGAIYGSSSVVINLSDSKFLTDTDTIYINAQTGKVNLSGAITLNAKIHGTGIVNVADDTTFNFDNDSEISIIGMTFAGGATMNFTGSKKVTFAKNQLLTGVTVTINGSDYTEAGTYTVAANAGNLSEENITFIQSASPWLSQSYDYTGTTLEVTVTDSSIKSGLCDAAIEDKNGVILIDGKYYRGAVYETIQEALADNTVAVMNNGTLTGETVTVASGKTLLLNGNITVNAALDGNGTYVIVKDTVFTNAVDFSAVNISVDGSLYSDKAVTIATGVAAIGNYTTGNENLFLTVENGNLILREANITSNVGSFDGAGSNLMTNGEVVTFFADKSGADNIATTIQGGNVASNLVGGAYVAAGKTAAVDNVELNVGGTAEFAEGSKAYAGGYLYGDKNSAEASATAQMTVGNVNINIDGGSIGGNMYGGAHARENGNAQVGTVNITVAGGEHSRIYAGGWAEKGAKSYVTTSNVTISGGVVDYLYGAGANADGETYVGTTNITVSDDAVVNTIYMGGRYGYSYVNTVNLTFAGENKELTRLSGVSSAGMESADATVVELKTNVTADLIDYIDKFIINENCTLTANNEFYLGNRIEGGAEPGVTAFDFVTDGLDEAWTAIAGIKDFANAQFSINGIAGTWDGNVMAIAYDKKNYTITKDETAGTITLAQVK